MAGVLGSTCAAAPASCSSVTTFQPARCAARVILSSAVPQSAQTSTVPPGSALSVSGADFPARINSSPSLP